MDIIKTILDWPIIVQGALGSFLFWLIFFLISKIKGFTLKRISKDKDLGYFFIQDARKSFILGDYNGSNYSFFVAIYAALHYFLKFVFAAFIGFIIQQIIPVIGYVGYLVGLYFLYKAFSYMPHFDTLDKMEEREEK